MYIYIHIFMNITQPLKRKKKPFAAIWMKLEIMKLSGISQKKKDENHMISLTGGI